MTTLPHNHLVKLHSPLTSMSLGGVNTWAMASAVLKVSTAIMCSTQYASIKLTGPLTSSSWFAWTLASQVPSPSTRSGPVFQIIRTWFKLKSGCRREFLRLISGTNKSLWTAKLTGAVAKRRQAQIMRNPIYDDFIRGRTPITWNFQVELEIALILREKYSLEKKAATECLHILLWWLTGWANLLQSIISSKGIQPSPCPGRAKDVTKNLWWTKSTSTSGWEECHVHVSIHRKRCQDASLSPWLWRQQEVCRP